MNFRRAGFVVLALLLVAGTLAAQDVTRGSLMIRVEDPTGAVIPGAAVALVGDVQSELRGETGGSGEILFSNLVPGTYTITVTFQGFKTARVESVNLRLSERRPITVVMEPGELVQTVEVIGGAGVIDIASTETGGSVDDTIYLNTPLRRGIASAFRLSPGVSSGGGTGFSNPSIGGASGFENLYLIDGVNVTDGGFGGFGAVSRVFGSLGQGTTTSFIKEVEIKSGGYDAKYGQALGGIINVITKSGGNEFHGALFGFYSPNKLEAGRVQANRFRSENFQNEEELGTMAVDFGFEVQGRILQDHLFFFGSLNPRVVRTQTQAPQVFDQFTFGPGDCNAATPGPANNALAGCSDLGRHDIRERSINYAIKLTGQISPSHRVDASIFGDPTIRKFGPLRRFTGTLDPITGEPQDFSRIDVSNLSLQVRYNGVITPNWLVSASLSNNHNRFEEQNLLNKYSVDDRTAASGARVASGGVGFFENQISDMKGGSGENTNIIDAGILGTHELSEGFTYETNNFKGVSRRTGPDFPVVSDPLLNQTVQGIDAVGLNTFGASFRLESCMVKTGTPDCFGQAPAAFQGATDTLIARQTRGAFFGAKFDTISRYTAAYVQDNWRMNDYLTVKLGLRWEQERQIGLTTDQRYTFSGSWGPRVGVILDPFANRKTKISFNFARFFQKLPNDLTLRTFEGEASILNLTYWVTPDKNIVPNQAAYVGLRDCGGGEIGYICLPGGGRDTGFAQPTISGNFGSTPFPGTKMSFQDELGVGFEHEVGNSGVLVGARYIDRRLKRLVEDFNFNTIEEAAGGFFAISFPLGNPSASADFFTNGTLIDSTAPGAACFSGTVGVLGPFNTTLPGPDGVLGTPDDVIRRDSCFSAASGSQVPDGLIDGLPSAIREYQAVQITLERRLRDNWQFNANWTISRLQGNFEGAFRNDNGQSDPGITSLFDFRDSQAFGDTYAVGNLPNSRRHVINAYGSYLFNEGPVSGLNIGANLRVSSGRALTELLAHPLFENAGEIACSDDVLDATDIRGAFIFSDETRRIGCDSAGRGGFDTTQVVATLDLRADHTVQIGENYSVRAGLDFFNVFNALRPQNRRMFKESAAGLADPDFNTPQGFQEPFKMRFSVRFQW